LVKEKDHLLAHRLICRFNKVWSNLAELQALISKVWSSCLKDTLVIQPCPKEFLISQADLESVLHDGPWFSSRSGLFMRPWQPSFNPYTETFSSIPIWVQMPNLSLEYWHTNSLTAIKNVLSKLLALTAEQTDVLGSTCD
jgi:hypothetical protein